MTVTGSGFVALQVGDREASAAFDTDWLGPGLAWWLTAGAVHAVLVRQGVPILAARFHDPVSRAKDI